MVRRSCCVVLWAVLAGSPALAQPWATKMFETTSHDFGSVPRSAKAEFRFVFRNLYLPDVHIADAQPSCRCTSTRIESALLKTHEKGAVVATLNTKNFRGKRDVTIAVTIDRPYQARVQLHVKGDIRDDVLLEPGGVTLGTVRQGTPVEKTVAVSRTGYGSWQVLEVKSSAGYLTAEVVETTRSADRATCRVRVRLAPDAPVGTVRNQLVLVTNDSRYRGIPLLVEALTVTPETLFLGVVEPGGKVTKQLVVRGGEPFRITAVTSDGGHFEFRPKLDDPPKPLHVIPLTFIAGEEPGEVKETVRIQTDLTIEPPQLATFAVVEAP